jgi:hypothetical protein
MMDASFWAAPSSKADKKARAVASICSLRLDVEGFEAMRKGKGILFSLKTEDGSDGGSVVKAVNAL